MQRRHWEFVAFFVFVFPGFVFPQDLDKPTRLSLEKQDIEDSLGTEWYGIYMLGKKAGYAKITMEKLADPQQPGYATKMEGNMTIKALGGKQEMKVVQTFEFDDQAPYPLRRALYLENARNASQETELIRTEKGFEVRKTADGEKKIKQIDPIDFTFADILTSNIWIRRGPKIGAKLTSRNYYLDTLEIDIEQRKLLSTKTSLVEGVKVTFHEVEMTSKKINIPSLERFNEKGQLLSGKIGGVVELRFEPEEQAKNIDLSTDLFLLGSVKIDQPLGDPKTITSLIIEIKGKEASVIKPGPRQTIALTETATRTLKTGKAHGASVKATDKEIEENLAESDTYPIHHPKVQALVKKAVGDASTPKEKVDRLVPFVAKYITPDYNTRPKSCLQILNVRKGACTEFALLFTTLARAAGIPAREIGGLVYMGDDQKTFGPHAWNEVVLDGVWLPIDTSWNETEINGTHISFGTNKADDLNWLANFLGTFGKLSFKLVEANHER
jgi:protein-glutamine gamma-glutamyltransferase